MTREEAIKKLKSFCHNCSKFPQCVNTDRECFEALEMAIQSLSVEITDGDLISRQAVSKYVSKMINNRTYPEERQILEDFIEWLENIPSAEKTAEWIKQKSGDELFPEEIVCSKCYHSNSHLDFDEHNNPIGKVFLESKYCPNCGAIVKKAE